MSGLLARLGAAVKRKRLQPHAEPTAKVCRDVGPIIYDATLRHAERCQQALAEVGMAYHLWRYEDHAHQPREENIVALRRSELDRAYRRSLEVLYEKREPIGPAQGQDTFDDSGRPQGGKS